LLPVCVMTPVTTTPFLLSSSSAIIIIINPARHSVMASSTASPNCLRRGCMCNWGAECTNLKKLLVQANDVLLTRMSCVQPGGSETSVALRSVVKFHLKLGPEHDDKVFCVAAHHWVPSLTSRNYEGSKGNRASRRSRHF
jgi:hypothetical protein